MSHYTMPNKYGKCTRDFGAFLFLFQSTFVYFGGVFNKTIILLALVGYEMTIANSALRASLAIYLVNKPLQAAGMSADNVRG